MGVLSTGRPLTWPEIVSARSILKKKALTDLISILNKHRRRRNDHFLWGDEVEYSIVRFDHENKRVQLSLKADQILSKLSEDGKNKDSSETVFHAEDCNFVVEGVPAKPYGSLLFHFKVQANMKLRREEIQNLLDKDEYIMTISLFPRYLNKNVIARRQAKVSVNVPIYRDVQTPKPFEDDFSSYGVENWERCVRTREDNHIHLDCSSMGWGCCCLQVTFQAASFDESVQLYDQLIPLTPIFLGLSVACPIWRGYISDVDSRWNILGEITDDRTEEEMRNNRLNSSRYSSVHCYLSDQSERFNDVPFDIDEDVYQTLLRHDCPSTLAKHFAHLFLRDPLYVTDEQLSSDSERSFAFENQNSMIWNSLRYKPPPSSNETSLGWRVEFRPMELQMSDVENAAFTVFLSLLTRAIFSFGVDLRMHISLVHQNMERAQRRNNIQQSKFHFPQNIFPKRNSNENETREMTMDEIVNGSKDFIGLKSLIINYLNSFEDIHLSTRQMIDNVLQIISQRAKGTLLTNAMFIRNFVLNHPFYQADSLLNDRIQYDFMWLIQQTSNNQKINPLLRSSDTNISPSKY